MMFKSIVLALDGSETAKRGIPIAIELAKEGKGKIVIAHVEERMATKGRAPLQVDEERDPGRSSRPSSRTSKPTASMRRSRWAT